MAEETSFDFEGPDGQVEGVGLDATANTVGILREDIRAALSDVETGATSEEVTITDRELAALTRSLRERPEIAKYLASRTGKHLEDAPPDDVDEVVAALVGIGLETVAPQIASVLDEESDAIER